MYTGIIEATGTVRNVDRELGDGLAANVECDVLAKYVRGEAVEA